MSRIKITEMDHKVVKAKIQEVSQELTNKNGTGYRVLRVQEIVDSLPQDIIFKEYGKKNGYTVGGEYSGILKISAWNGDLQIVAFSESRK
jgi:hypothetical protein